MGSIAVCVTATLVLLVLGSWGCQDKGTAEQATKDWWETAQFYQIYPRSFMDSNGDGIGDLNGITSKLEYLRDIGVTAAWLSPIFTSPMVDFGYDISDFYGIQPEYGSIEDFRAMTKRAKELGIKIILDFVPNHSSDENEWFKKSVKKERGYEDFYVWHDGYLNTDGSRSPPSNWLQAFRGSAWKWNDERQQFYLHQFAVQQPDLNYRNPAVVQQMKRVLTYWLDQGVSGFRCDAVPVLFEAEPDETGRYPDEEITGLTDDPDDRNYVGRVYTENLPETIDMIYQWRALMDEYQRIYGGDTKVLLIETYAPIPYTMQMYGNSQRKGAHLPFNFNLITQLDTSMTAPKVKQAVDNWLDYMPAGRTANWVIGNHDQRRAASRYGVTRIDAMLMLVMMLPGASVTYQGEELGMIDGEISWEDTKDPAACNSNQNIYEKFTRDPSRTPFHWSAGVNAGFSTGSSTWLPLAPDYQTLNVEVENAATRSHLKVYKALVQLRKSSRTLQFGDWKYQALNSGVFILKRSLADRETIIFIANLNDAPYNLNIQADFDSSLPSSLMLKVQSISSTKNMMSSIATNNIQLEANEALVLSTS